MSNQGTMYRPDEVSPPGETLRDVLEERGVSQADLALRMGRPQKTISEIINGKAAITPDTALGFELVLGIPAAFWLTRESAYREFLARVLQVQQLNDGKEWAKQFPLHKMQELGWISKPRNSQELVRSLLEFFGVASPTQWHELYAAYSVSFRKSAAFESNEFALGAWLRAGIVSARQAEANPYDRHRFVDALHAARAMTRMPVTEFQPALRSSMAAAGVVVVFVPEVPKSRASGATRWLTPTKALIQLSLRYKSDDQLWFTFFHEAAHVLLHSKKSIFIEGGDHQGLEESEANEWAADFLIPPSEWLGLSRWPSGLYTKAAVRSFAENIGISPGIVVGRLQHAKILPHSHLNDLKRRFEWSRHSIEG